MITNFLKDMRYSHTSSVDKSCAEYLTKPQRYQSYPYIILFIIEYVVAIKLISY
jgi:hypothetical protein